MNRHALITALAILFLAQTCGAQDPALPVVVKEALERRIIDPALPLSEVQAYTESRVLPMPELTTVPDWENFADRTRQQVFNKVVFRGAASEWRDRPTNVEWQDVIEGGPGYRIRKLRYEVVPGMWTAAVLYEPLELRERVPVVLNVNGHDRTGKAADYKQMRCINQAKRGMLALNVEWLGMGQLATPGFGHYSMNQMNLCGTSGLAPFYLAMSRGLDILLQHESADPTRVAVAGLSGGGWQTIFISSLDTRVTLCNPVAGYSSFKTRARFLSDLGDSEQTPCDLASVTDYAQLTAMLAPRAALLTNNADDKCCFKAEHALPPLLEAAQPVYQLYGKPQNLRYHVNHDPGTHNFLQDNRQQLYRLLGDFFFAGDSSYRVEEIPSESEIKTAEQLHVELPADNQDFNSIALKLSDRLMRTLPENDDALKGWQQKQRPVLQEVIRSQPLHTVAIRQGWQAKSQVEASWWWLRFGGDWTVPAVELSAPGSESQPLAILIADNGRSSMVAEATRLLESGHRVLALDPFFFGESKIAERDFLYAILISSLGDRPLGIQADQLAAAAKWARAEFGCRSVKLVASGPRTGLMALTAAAITDDIDGVEITDCRGSLRELLEQNLGVNQVPESLCFGLLQHFDIAELVAAAGPDRVTLVNPSDRCRTELKALTERLPQLTQKLFVDR